MTNRPIKFRAWDKKKKCWMVDFLVKHTGELVEFQGGYAGYDMEYPEFPENYDLMQFTGLTDKNGKEIYEGDIIESFVLLSETGENIRTVVKWGENGWLANGALSNNPQWMNNHQPEVIGNIWENPELLNHD